MLTKKLFRPDLVAACFFYMVCLFNLAAHRQGYRVTTIHMGNGWVTLQPCLCAAELNHVKTIEFRGES